MEGRSEETSFYRILVAIEADATRFHGADASRPQPLDQAVSEQMLAHLAADLKTLLPAISDCSLITAGALYDQTQILRPDYPVFKALEKVPTDMGADRFRSGLVSVGADGGTMPLPALQPLEGIPLGLLQLLPLVVHGPAERISELGQDMEFRFLEEGQLSAHSAAWLESAFGIAVNHARLMTLTDLNAMFRLQLEHFGFIPLWELLDAALNGRPDSLTVNTESGQAYEWRDGRVHSRFETFNSWASQGQGRDLAASRQALAGGYGEWTRQARQYLTTLRAHGLDVQYHAADGRQLEGTFFAEADDTGPGENDAAITEHSFEELGTIAITAVHDGRVLHYYPLVPQGLNDIHAYLRKRVPAGQTIAFPNTILYDRNTRQLVPDNHVAPQHASV
jgi:hypothetical protein